jgi:glycosyltransferase involved in cell wall biosynthesis
MLLGWTCPVKVLYANKYFFRKGGAETVIFDEMSFMRNSNVEVIEFAMDNPQNVPSPYSSYFVSERDYHSQSLRTKIKSGATFIHSWEAVKKISDLIRAKKPDVLHCHNIYHQLTPSIITDAARLDVPVVLTLHDLKIVCPIHTRFRDGAICTACSRDRFWPVVRHRCAGHSLSRGLLLWAEAHYHSFKQSYEHVSKVVVPSRFMRDSIAPWFEDAKIVHVPNGVDTSRIEVGTADGGFALYCGRLSPEKGVETLLQAHAEDNNAWRLVVAGTGPSAQHFRSRYPLAEFTGHLSGADLARRIGESSIVVVPSECEENCPLSIIEAMAYAKPVVASRVGGIPELVRHGETGLLFQPNDRRDLSTKIQTLMNDSDLRRRFGSLARKVAESDFSLISHGHTLLSVYRELRGLPGRRLARLSA